MTIPRSADTDEAFSKSENVRAENLFDEGNSLDLSPIKITRDETIGLDDEERSGFVMENEMLDDTFHYRRHVRALG